MVDEKFRFQKLQHEIGILLINPEGKQLNDIASKLLLDTLTKTDVEDSGVSSSFNNIDDVSLSLNLYDKIIKKLDRML